MRPQVQACVLCGAIMFGVAGCQAATATGRPGIGDPPPQSRAILVMTNQQRSRAGLRPLRETPRLSRAAQLHAEQMAHAARLEHVLPGERHPRPADRLSAAGYKWEAWAENLANGGDPAAVVTRWMASAAHRGNMLNPSYTETGAGFSRGYYFQMFGRPSD